MKECCLDGLRGICISLPEEAVADLTRPGEAEPAARYWAAQPAVAAQLDALGHDLLAAALLECGAWSAEELQDAELTRMRAVWVAAGDGM